MVFDFKQKLLAKSFRKGGDSYYGKKAGVYAKPETRQNVRSSESIEECHVEIDFTAEKVQLLQQMEVVNKGNVQEDAEKEDNDEEDGVEKVEEEEKEE